MTSAAMRSPPSGMSSGTQVRGSTTATMPCGASVSAACASERAEPSSTATACRSSSTTSSRPRVVRARSGATSAPRNVRPAASASSTRRTPSISASPRRPRALRRCRSRIVDCRLLAMGFLTRSGPAMRNQYAKKRRRSLPLLAGALGLVGAAACAVGVQEERQPGHQYAAAVAARRDLPWTFRVVNTTDVNAFAIPGGHIYVTRGLIEHATSYNQLAGVLGHEIGHVDLRHTARQIEKQRAAALGVGLGYIVLGREPGAAEGQALNVVAAAVFARFSREDERAADHAGGRYTTAAGLDHHGPADR